MKGTAVLLGNQTRPTHLRNIELLLRIRVPRVVLILEIERNILEIERSILQIGRNILIVTNPSLSTDPLPRLGHKIDLEMAHDTDHRVGTDNNVAIHHVTQRVQIILATQVTDLVPNRQADRLQTEITPGAGINTAKAPAGAPLLAGKVIAHFVAKTNAILENAPLLIKISELDFLATSALLPFITEHLLTDSFKNSRPLNRPLLISLQ